MSTPVDSARDGHLLLLHRSETERRARLASWVRRGLDSDEKVICTHAAVDAAPRAVLALLRQEGIDVATATAERRLQVVPLTNLYPADAQLRVVEEALDEGFRAVRMSAEANSALATMPPDAYAGLERTMDQICRNRPVSALCQYDRATTTGPRLHEAAERHPTGVQEQQLQSMVVDQGLALAGEIDFTNDEVLTATLRAATGSASGVFRLDLSAVTFLSAGGLRALAVGTEQFRDAGGDVEIISPQPRVERALRLLSVDALAHVTVLGGQQ